MSAHCTFLSLNDPLVRILKRLWDKLNAKRGYGLSLNDPLVRILKRVYIDDLLDAADAVIERSAG